MHIARDLMSTVVYLHFFAKMQSAPNSMIGLMCMDPSQSTSRHETFPKIVLPSKVNKTCDSTRPLNDRSAINKICAEPLSPTHISDTICTTCESPGRGLPVQVQTVNEPRTLTTSRQFPAFKNQVARS